MKHILASEQFDAGQLETVFDRADEFRETQRRIHDRREVMKLHEGRIMLSTFYEPSTRTRISFEVAAWKLGFKISGTENASEFSSAAKGESIEDTIKVFNEYGVDAISLRTKEDGYANRAAAVSDVAILNGGDGIGEHPTQAVLDMYTIQNNFEQLSNLNVVIGGDLAHGRTARSLALLLSKYPGNRISFVSTPELQIGRDIKAKLHEDGTRFSETGEMYDALRTANVVYWTRLQKERLKPAPEAVNPLESAIGRFSLSRLVSPSKTKKVETVPEDRPSIDQTHFILDTTALDVMPSDAIIMHPLPRTEEIPAYVDEDPRAVYFKQAGNGLYVRMAMLDQIAKNIEDK